MKWHNIIVVMLLMFFSVFVAGCVDDNQISIGTKTLSEGKVANSYSQRISASGGNPPYSWSIIYGSLPNSMSLSNSGVISGIPTDACDYVVVVAVEDSRGNVSTKAFSIRVAK